jgi:hypothetical protein
LLGSLDDTWKVTLLVWLQYGCMTYSTLGTLKLFHDRTLITFALYWNLDAADLDTTTVFLFVNSMITNKTCMLRLSTSELSTSLVNTLVIVCTSVCI